MRFRVAFLVLSLLAPAVVFAAPSNCPKSFKKDDICTADILWLQTKDTDACPFTFNSGTISACKAKLQKLQSDNPRLSSQDIKKLLCRTVYNPSAKTFSRNVGWLEVKEDGVDKIPFISKCDPNYASVTSAGLSGTFTPGLSEKDYVKAAVNSIDTSTDAGLQQLTDVLHGMGVTNVTKEQVDAKPDAAKQLALLINDENQDGAQKAAKELGLNEDLGDVSRMSAGARKAVDDNLPPGQIDEAVKEMRAQQTGFNAPPDAPTPQDLPRNVLYPDSGDKCYTQPNRYGQFSQCVMSQGYLQQIQGNPIRGVSASTYGEGTVTANGERFNPYGYTVASKTLPFGTQVLVYNPGTGQAVVATVNDRGPFVDSRDIDLSLGTASAIGFKGLGNVDLVVLGSGNQTGRIGQYGSVNDAFAAYQQSNGAIAVGAGNVQPSIAAQASGPFGGLFGGNVASGQTPQGWFGGSPIGNNMPTSRTSPVAYNSPVGVAGGGVAPSASAPIYPATPATPVSSLINPSAAQPQLSSQAQALQQALQGNGSSGTAGGAPVNPVATIIAQSSEVVHGRPILISWSSVGMSAASPCRVQVSVGDSVSTIAQSNEGSKTIPTSSSTPTGVWTFTLQCTSRSGASVGGQTVSVSVQ